MYRNNDDTDDQSHWHNSCRFKASLFPLIYYDERKERLLHLLFQLLFLFELVSLYLEVLLYQEVVCFIVMVYSLYLQWGTKLLGQLTRYEIISLPFPSPQAMLQFVQLCTLEPVLNVFRHPNIV